MTETVVKFLHPQATVDHVGMIPYWLSSDDPRPAKDQLNTAYVHGGGWHSFGQGQWRITRSNFLHYPGDPPLIPLAEINMRDELIVIYDCSIVAIIQPDRSFEVARMD